MLGKFSKFAASKKDTLIGLGVLLFFAGAYYALEKHKDKVDYKLPTKILLHTAAKERIPREKIFNCLRHYYNTERQNQALIEELIVFHQKRFNYSPKERKVISFD